MLSQRHDNVKLIIATKIWTLPLTAEKQSEQLFMLAQ